MADCVIDEDNDCRWKLKTIGLTRRGGSGIGGMCRCTVNVEYDSSLDYAQGNYVLMYATGTPVRSVSSVRLLLLDGGGDGDRSVKNE